VSEVDREQLPTLAWDEAEVHDGELHVALTAQAPRGWASRFRRLLIRLDSGGETRWGRISVSRQEVKVADVAEGGEEDLRHLLESVLLQVNADLTPEEAHEAEPSPARERDERLTHMFRGFAGDV
jgi:hypothetical protein